MKSLLQALARCESYYRSAGDTDDIVDSNMHDELLKNDGLYHGL